MSAAMTAGDLLPGVVRRQLSATRTVLFAACHMALVLLGRATVVDGASVSIFWPAAGVVLLWLLAESTRRWPLVLAVVGVELAFGLGLTGAPAVFVATGVLSVWAQSLVVVVAVRHTMPWLLGAGGHETVRSPRALAAVTALVVLGCLVGAAIGTAGLWATDTDPDVGQYLLWWGRQVAGAMVVGSVGHLGWEWFTDRPPPRAYGGGRRELGVLAVVSVVATVAVFRQPLPLVFLLVPLSVWCASRFATFLAAVHATTMGGVALLLTALGSGPYSRSGGSYVDAMIIQVFVLVTLLTALAVGTLSDRIDQLVVELGTSLRESAARADLLRGVTESMGEGLVVLDPTGAVVMSNGSSHRLARRLAPGVRDGAAVPALLRALEPDEGTLARHRAELGPGDVAVRLADGQEVVLAVTSAPVGDPDDPGRLLVLREVTAHRAGLRPLVDFASTVAHDLRGPLTVMHTWLSLVDESPQVAADEHLRGAVERINRGALQMSRLIDDLLSHALAEGGTLSPEDVALSGPDGVVPEVVEMLGVPAGTVSLGADLPAVHADRGAVRQVVANLLDNAVKYARPGVAAHVEVGAVRAGDRVLVRLADNGVGVPADDRDAIFDRFNRGGAAGTAARGSGIGLSICRTILERHGGTIACLPREDGPGSVFTFDLPAAGS